MHINDKKTVIELRESGWLIPRLATHFKVRPVEIRRVITEYEINKSNMITTFPLAKYDHLFDINRNKGKNYKEYLEIDRKKRDGF